jgi:hypothetical protein
MSFFGALVNIGAMCGAVAGGWTAERFGRCRTSMLASLLFLFGYLLIATAYSYSQLLFGRMLTGVGVGLVSFVTPVYIAEISPPRCDTHTQHPARSLFFVNGCHYKCSVDRRYHKHKHLPQLSICFPLGSPLEVYITKLACDGRDFVHILALSARSL